MRIVICWASISGYMAACWRALAATPGVELLIVCPRSGNPGSADFSASIVQGLNCRIVTEEQAADFEFVGGVVTEYRPQVVVIGGWLFPAFVQLASHPPLQGARFILAIDTPYRGTLRQHLGRFAHRRFFGRIDRVVVAGERAWQLARRLGFGESKIQRGTYGVDYDRLLPLFSRRLEQPGGWPRRFLFMGRYHEQKGIVHLLEGYSRYRAAVSDPWPLTTCGAGPLTDLVRKANPPGVTDQGFVQPPDQPAVLVSHGAFVLASVNDPWPLVVVESCAAGLPVLCTEACGSAVELVRTYYNGLTCATADPDALAAGLRWLHEHDDLLPEFGRRSTLFAAAYSAEQWAIRWSQMWADVPG